VLLLTKLSYSGPLLVNRLLNKNNLPSGIS
jgi:hypothetical protein